MYKNHEICGRSGVSTGMCDNSDFVYINTLISQIGKIDFKVSVEWQNYLSFMINKKLTTQMFSLECSYFPLAIQFF